MTTLTPLTEVDRFMLAAEVESRKSEQRFKVGCVIVKKGKVVALGHNQSKSHPLFGNIQAKPNYPFLHAECSALWDAKKKGIDVSGTIVYVYRKNHLLSRPCDHCHQMLEMFDVKEVRYSA